MQNRMVAELKSPVVLSGLTMEVVSLRHSWMVIHFRTKDRPSGWKQKERPGNFKVRVANEDHNELHSFRLSRSGLIEHSVKVLKDSRVQVEIERRQQRKGSVWKNIEVAVN